MIERRIIIGLIVSTDYMTQVSRFWDDKYLESDSATRLSQWCWEYYDKYNRSPGKDIEGIFVDKLESLPTEIGNEIEQDILPGLSEEYEREDGFNVQYLIDQTKEYFRKRHLEIHKEDIEECLETGELEKAEQLASGYEFSPSETGEGIELGCPESLERVKEAFKQEGENVISFPGELGKMVNDYLIRGAFVSFRGIDKVGKSWTLIDACMRGVRQGSNIAFFEAGDMTEGQVLRRIGIYLAKRSDRECYTGIQFVPVKDCVWNQLGTCSSPEREGFLPVLEHYPLDLKEFRKKLNYEDLIQSNKEVPGYLPCTNCPEYHKAGSVWFEEVDLGTPLEGNEAAVRQDKFFNKCKGKIRLSAHPNGTLSVSKMGAILNNWERRDGFVPDVIALDYAELLDAEFRSDVRHQINKIYGGLRGMSQKRHALVLTLEQADAGGYESDTLSRKNFSEDKRRNAHLTACFGLNRDKDDREKDMGLLRVNEIVVREGDFSANRQVYVIQCLKRGRPFLGSFR